MNTLYKIKISNEYIDLMNDLTKIISVLLILNLLLYLDGLSENLINLRYLRISFLIIVSFITYWLIVNKLIVFSKKNDVQ